MHEINEAISQLKALMPDTRTLFFGSVIYVKKSPHSWPVKISAIKELEGNLWVKHEGAEWELFNGDRMVINSINQRLRGLLADKEAAYETN